MLDYVTTYIQSTIFQPCLLVLILHGVWVSHCRQLRGWQGPDQTGVTLNVFIVHLTMPVLSGPCLVHLTSPVWSGQVATQLSTMRNPMSFSSTAIISSTYCKFESFHEGFIFANLRICKVS